MRKNRREVLLGVLFVTLIAIAGLWESIGAIILQPLSDAQASVESARANLIALKDQETIVDQAIRNLKEIDVIALPPDRGQASSMYQGWLISQLETCSIDSPIVTPGPAIKEDAVGNRMPFVVQFTAESKHIAEFLDRFHATPLLHRITNLHIVRSSDGESDHRVMLSIEALAMECGLAAETLPDPIAVDDALTLAALISHNDFLGGTQPEPAAATTSTDVAVQSQTAGSTDSPLAEAPQPLVRDPHQSVRFIASVWNGRQREAWLIDRRSMQEMTVLASAELAFPGIAGCVVSVGEDSLQLNLNGQLCRLELGQSLSEASFTQSK